MNKNELVELEINDIGNDGEGIGKIDGFTLFVKDTVPGDYIEARIVKIKKNYGYGRVERVLKPSPFRVMAECEFARPCGGCQLMEMSYTSQLEFKNKKVKNNLVRIGGFDEKMIENIMEEIVGMDSLEESPLRYRNKSQFPIGLDKESNIIAGFYAGRTHSIIKCKDCKLGPKENSEILTVIINHMKKYGIRPYDEKDGKGLVRHVLIRKGFYTNEIMVCLVINGNEIPRKEILCDELSKIENMTSISYSINKEKTNVIMGNNYHVIWGRETISDLLKIRTVKSNFSESKKPLEFKISPLSFYQVNPIQVEKLYGIAADYAMLTGKEEVWDICCGIGTITLSMASNAKTVHGIEIVEQAIADARKNAINNNIQNAEFICDAAEEYLPQHATKINADVLIMDPPRKGMDVEALKAVLAINPERIVYISCDSATLARDLKFLCENNYELKKVRACDMFPQTVHIECIVCIQKIRDKND